VSTATSELLLFRVGPRVFAAPVGDALRVGPVRDVPPDALVAASALGAPAALARGIAVDAGDGAPLTLAVDAVLGVRSVASDDVRPLPAFAAACLASGAVTGIVLVDDAPMLLVDLPTLVRERSVSRDLITERASHDG
jgi:chemotaxis signal transduction protein